MNFFKVITSAVLIIQLFSSLVIAQKTSKYADIRNVDIKLSDLQKDNDHAKKVLGYSNNIAYLDLSYYGNRIRIYDETKNEFTNIIELKKEGGLYKSSGTEFLNSYSIDGKLYLIHENYSKSDNVLNLFATIIDKDGNFLTKEKVFFSIECKKRSDVKFKVRKEADFLLIGAVTKKENDKALTMAKYTFEFEKIDITNIDSDILNNNGEGIFLEPIHGYTDELFLTAIHQSIPKKKKGKSISTIYAVNKDGKLSFSQQLNVDRFNLFEFKIFKTGKTTIIRAYYSDDNSAGIDGIVQFAYDSKLKKFIVKDTYKISSNVKSKFMNAGKVEDDRGITPFSYQDVLVTKDNKMYVLNVREITTRNTTNPGQNNGGSTVYYSYSTGEYQMLEVYDSTGKIISVTNVKTKDLSINYGDKTMHLISNGESVAIVYLLNHQVSLEVKGEKKLRKMYAPQFISNLDNLNQQKDIYIETAGDKKFRRSLSFLLGNTGKILIANYRTITIGAVWVSILNLPIKYRIGVAQMPLK